ncbi:MAG: ABC transporter ATP-binding protein [Candidatus Kapaibacterium sp.]
MKKIISIEKISKSYHEGNNIHHVLTDVTESINESEIIILLGKSGSGKSTLLNLLSGIDRPDSGKIIIEKKEITSLNENKLTLFRREKIGFVFQFFNLIPTLTVIENLLLPAELLNIDEKKARNTAAGLLERVGLRGRENSYPDVLSGGEQQRVAIARALMSDPAIILADEPTGNLDHETGRDIMNLLENLVREQGKTLIMATHSRELSAIGDRVFTVKQGSIKVTAPENV